MNRVFVYSIVLSLAAAAIISTAAPYAVNITAPSTSVVNNGGSVYLGKVGPGQTFIVTISENTTNSTGTQFSQGWNEFLVTDLPQGWAAANASLNQPGYLSAKITAAPRAANGPYEFNLTAINQGNYSKLGAVHFTALINVTTDVFALSVSPTVINTGPGEPAKILVTINNTGVSDAPFVINATGLPAWNLSIPVIALHHTTETFEYPVYENEPGNYTANLTVSSSSTPLVHESSAISIQVQASILNDYRAIGEGALAFPVIYEPAYAIMYLIGKLFGG